MKSKPKFVFVIYNNETASMHMRGIAVSKALNRHNIESQCITNEQISKVNIDENTICVIIKVPFERTISHIKKHNGKIAFDPVDSWDWNRLKFDHDIVIAAHDKHANHMAQFYKGPIISIPHLHTNVNRTRKKVGQISTVGYVGQHLQLTAGIELKEYCRLNKLKWHMANKKTHSEIEKETLTIDIGVVYVDKSVEDRGLNLNYNNIIDFKPTTKMMNFFSYGIPCIVNDGYYSFGQVINADKDMSWLSVKDKHDLLKKISLLRDRKLYSILSNKCYAAAEPYHLDNAVEYYVNRLCAKL
jgi:hypothetical protein